MSTIANLYKDKKMKIEPTSNVASLYIYSGKSEPAPDIMGSAHAHLTPLMNTFFSHLVPFSMLFMRNNQRGYSSTECLRGSIIKSTLNLIQELLQYTFTYEEKKDWILLLIEKEYLYSLETLLMPTPFKENAYSLPWLKWKEFSEQIVNSIDKMKSKDPI